MTRIASPQGDLYYGYDDMGRKAKTWTGNADSAQATTLTEYGYDQLNRLVKTTASRRFGQPVDVDPVANGVQPDATRTIFATDGQIDYELVPTAGGDVTKDYSYDSQGRVESIHHFADAGTINHVYNVGETLLSAPSTHTTRTGAGPAKSGLTRTATSRTRLGRTTA